MAFGTKSGLVGILLFVFSSMVWGNTQDEELAEKFSPILILAKEPENPDRKVIFPEPVEIMGVTKKLGKFDPLTWNATGQAHG